MVDTLPAASFTQITTEGPPALATAALPVAQIQRCENLNKIDKENSALHQNLKEKGGNAYYFAHGRSYEIPVDAKVITGPGLVSGGPPQRLSATGEPLEAADQSFHDERLAAALPANFVSKAIEEKEAISLKEYSWSDGGSTKVKMYITCDGLMDAPTEGLVNARFEPKGIALDVATSPPRRFRLEKMSREIKPDECTFRVDAAKSRITLTLIKKRGGVWTSLT